MKRKKVQKLTLGLYRIYWKSGGSSLAAVGNTADGTKWMAPINWITHENDGSAGTSARRHWRGVKKMELIKS